ncbi:hypothetical protein GCM10023166_07100 [Paeniglutamicibacter cryotolerans]
MRRIEINGHETIDVFIGVDVGKTNHHAVALDRPGKKLLGQGPAPRRGQAPGHHPVPGQARDTPLRGGPVRDHRRAAGRHRPRRRHPGRLPARTGHAPDRGPAPSGGQSDPKDVFIIANGARTLPHTLRTIEVPQEQIAELSMR